MKLSRDGKTSNKPSDFQYMVQAPVRIDLAGGTLDIQPLAAILGQALTVNLAVRYYQTVIMKASHRWEFVNENTGERWSPDGKIPPQFDLIWSAVQSYGGIEPCHVCLRSEVPRGSGLGGSSSMLTALIASLNLIHGYRIVRRALIYMAKEIETRFLRLPTGFQDYLAAIYGGLNAWEWLGEGWNRINLNPWRAWTVQRCMLVYLGEPHFSGAPNWAIVRSFLDGDPGVEKRLKRIRVAALELVDALVSRDSHGVARTLSKEMDSRAELHSSVVSSEVREALEWKAQGVHAVKVCGAGGGGCVVFWIDPEKRKTLIQSAQERGWQVLTPLYSAGPLRWKCISPGAYPSDC